MKQAVFFLIAFAVFLSACAAPPTPTPEPTNTKLPPTSTTIPPTFTPLPPTYTPFPESCIPSDSSLSELLNSLETIAKRRNVDGFMDLFAENAVYKETYYDRYFDNTEDIESYWRGYFSRSLPCEFRDIQICGDSARFIWAELDEDSAWLYPMVIVIENGKIVYMELYDRYTWVSEVED
jgi:hypothetical protein